MTALAITSLSAKESILIALSGIVIVFLMLACLCVIILAISKIVGSMSKETKEQNAPVAVAEPVASKAPSGGTFGGEIKLIDIDEKTAACIMAIVSDQTGIPLSELVFKKIRAL